MKKSYYLFNPGKLSRKDSTLKFTPVDADGVVGNSRYLPIEGIKNLYVFGSLDANSALYNFLGRHHVPVHFFDYHEHYSGSFMPKEFLLAGKMQVAQTEYYLSDTRRLTLARLILLGAAHNMRKNLCYYQNRGKDLGDLIESFDRYQAEIVAMLAPDRSGSLVAALMGLEGNLRQTYYQAFDRIMPNSGFEFTTRSRRPPQNELNALISFGNMMAYTASLDQIYHTQLNPTISFLHEPGARRYSLALDLAEIFKPLLVDRLIFKLVNKRQIQAQDFDRSLRGFLLKEKARKVFVQEWDQRLRETIKHRVLNKQVSYGYLIRLECYKLAKHCLEIERYQPFKAWW
ncbi:type I-B CRISPR-associated endonuclease Cas1b [Pontibacter sp. G13]|uniref:type I-B CRISPR-associated endonuclease Cas1b n=1 Tax=Pontibacter sp. G13 TaxID=3074898 RepID=UPI002889F4DF|nr:type I-B CRISPR-associated endonuclease Cas1b [Pontibacter sp. G13]WNJ20037.1 type I-B CRISPR-associated endonuclease Cas1b [Pontibacter sp. G13]